MERIVADHASFGPTRTLGVSVQWLATYDLAYLPPTLWDDGGSASRPPCGGGLAMRHGKLGSGNLVSWRRAAGGVMYRSPGGGFTTVDRYDAQVYARPEITATATRSLGKRTTLGGRLYAAGIFSADPNIVAAPDLHRGRRSVSVHVESIHSRGRSSSHSRRLLVSLADSGRRKPSWLQSVALD